MRKCWQYRRQIIAFSTEGIEAFIGAYLEKKLSKDLPPSKNPPELQQLIDESKGVEWETITEKHAVKVHYGKKALQSKAQHGDRSMGSHSPCHHSQAAQDGVIV